MDTPVGTHPRIDIEFQSPKRHKTTERAFENDVEAILRKAGWATFASNAVAQADYDRKLALKVGSLVSFVRETQPEEREKIERLSSLDLGFDRLKGMRFSRAACR